MRTSATNWVLKDRAVSLKKPLIVGILNVTPDSFSDGGKYLSLRDALAQASKMYKLGARIIDVGGESTRPGAKSVSTQKQISRIIPVIEGLTDGIVSVDTTNAVVAAAAIEAGASIINDVSAGTEDPAMLKLAASSGVGLVLMHRLVVPEKDKYSDQYDVHPEYDDVVNDVLHWLLARVEIAIEHGVNPKTIAIDPGLGFGKSVEQNMDLVHGIGAFVKSGFPVFVGASRKSFVGVVSGISKVDSRDVASAEVAKAMRVGGAQVFRVHDVRTHAGVLQSFAHEVDNNYRR